MASPFTDVYRPIVVFIYKILCLVHKFSTNVNILMTFTKLQCFIITVHFNVTCFDFFGGRESDGGARNGCV